MNRTDRIKKATLEARNSWTIYTESQLLAIIDLLDAASAEITQTLANYEKAGEIQRARLSTIKTQVNKELARMRISLNGHITRGVNRSIDYGMESGVLGMASAGLPGNYKTVIGTGYLSKSGLVVKYNSELEDYASSKWAAIHGRALDSIVRYNPEGLTLSDRVWNVTWESEKAIKRSINLGVLQGKSAASISREIRGFLNEPKALYRRVRKDGKLVLSQAARDYHPGRGVYRSAAKNAMRLARTEYQRAFHEGMIRYGASKKWIDGFIWRIGNVDACPICRELNGRFFEKGNIPVIPHSQCLCSIEPHIKGDELPADIKTGKPDPAIVGKILTAA